MMRWLILFLIPVSVASATVRYVDSAAVGSNDGTSWANAFTNLSVLTEAWQNANITAGDIFYISGGTYSGLTLRRGGTQASPVIYKASQEVGHNTHVTTGAFTFSGNATGDANWITLDGAISDAYTNLITCTMDVPNITNNLGWTILLTLTADNQGACITQTSDGKTGMNLKWLELTHANIETNNEAYAIIQKNTTGTRSCGTCYASNHINYVWAHNISQDTYKNLGQTNTVGFDGTEIGWCLFEEMGDDGVEANGSYVIHNCIIRNARDDLNRGHPDGISGACSSYTKIYNNIIHGFQRSQVFYLLTLNIANTNIWIYGNLFYWTPDGAAQASKTTAALGMEDLWWNYYTPGVDTNSYWHDVRILNNTFVAHPPQSTAAWSWFNRYAGDAGGSNVVIQLGPCLIANNIKYGGLAGFGFPSTNNLAYVYTTNDSGMYNNISAGTNSAAVLFSFQNLSTNQSGLTAGGVPSSGNITNTPLFVNGADYGTGEDFRLSVAYQAARNGGTNLSALVAEMPSLDVDIWGNTRGADGFWDIGASEEGTGPIVWLRFTNDFSAGGGTLTDSSGNGLDFIRFGVTNTAYPSNFLTSISASTYLGRWTGYAAQAMEIYIQPPDVRSNFESGAWAGLTNVSAFTNMSQMSFAFWAAADTNRDNYSATVLSAGDSGVGVWEVGRWFSFSPTNNLKFLIVTNNLGGGDFERCLSLIYPSGTRDMTWHHYAGTFSNGICNIYFEGTNCGSTTLLGGITNLQYTPTTSKSEPTWGYHPWIGLGCRTHDGTPTIEDWSDTANYPNNGWWSGGLGDVRIYNRVLTAVEIAALAIGSTPSVVSVGTVRAGRMIAAP